MKIIPDQLSVDEDSLKEANASAIAEIIETREVVNAEYEIKHKKVEKKVTQRREFNPTECEIIVDQVIGLWEQFNTNDQREYIIKWLYGYLNDNKENSI
jgi:hypothetical protein